MANAISKLLPHETILYFGDTAHLPYGDKSPTAIKHYAEKIAEFLISKGSKAIVIACNTASSFAYDHLKDIYKDDLPILNVIDPVVEHAVANERINDIGVIGTKGTIQSGIYSKKLQAQKDSLTVHAMATPLFAPMIEEGFINCEVSRTVISEYLDNDKLKPIQSLILACTHYPIIRDEIAQYLHNEVEVYDTAGIVAQYAKQLLKDKGLLNKEDRSATHHFYVSDYTDFFEKTTKLFFKEAIHLELYPIWEIESTDPIETP